MNAHVMRLVLVLLCLVAWSAPGAAQMVTGTRLTVGPNPTPPSGSSVRLDGLATTGGTAVVFTTPTDDLVARALTRVDLPAGIAFVDAANVFTAANTFSSTVNVTGLLTTGAITAGGAVQMNSTATVAGAFTASTTATVQGVLTAGTHLDLAGNLRFTSTGQRITGLMDGPVASRLAFQTRTANATTTVTALPNGTAVNAGFVAYDRADPTNGNWIGLISATGQQFIYSGASGTATVTPLSFSVGSEVFRMNDNADHMVLGGSQAGIRYLASANVSGQRWWRAGNYGSGFGVWGGADDGATYASLWRGTLSSGVPDGMFYGTGVRQVSPDKPYFTNLGSLFGKYLALHASELWVEQLVAQDVLATVGGRVLVGPTTTLTADYAASATMYVKHNNVAAGDILFLEGPDNTGTPAVEFIAVHALLGPCPANCPAGVTGYAYQIASANMDGSGSNVWPAGSAVFNTGGQAGQGWIDIYAARGSKPGSSQYGPTIVGNVRNDGTWNNWAPRFAVGNLSGLYGYGGTATYGAAFGDPSATWVSTDASYGFRGMVGNGQNLIVHPSGYIRIGRPDGTLRNLYTDGAQLILYEGQVPRFVFNATSLQFRDTGGTTYTEFGATGSTFGYSMTDFGNVHINNNGQLYMRSGSTVRMTLDASNGSMTWYRPDGLATMQVRSDVAQFGGVDTGARMVTGGGVTQLYGGAGTLWMHLDSGNGVLLGNWSVVDKTYMQVYPDGSALYFCRAGVSCPLNLSGATGNITSTGNIILSTGGRVTSSSNFTLGNAEGLRFERWTDNTGSANQTRSINWYNGGTQTAMIGQANNNALMLYVPGTTTAGGVRSMVGNTNSGFMLTYEAAVNPSNRVVNAVLQAESPTVGAAIHAQFVANLNGLSGPTSSAIGASFAPWGAVYSSTYFQNSTQGVGGAIAVINGNTGGKCHLYFTGGIFYYTSCPVE